MSHEIALEEEFARKPLRRATIRRLSRYLRPHARPLVTALALEIVWVMSMILDVRLSRIALDGPIVTGDVGHMWVLAGWLLLNLLARVLLTIYELGVTTRVGIEVVHDIRQDVFDHVQRLSMRYFDRTKQGRIIARADRDVDTLEHLILWGPIVTVSLAFSMVLGFGMILTQSLGLAVWLLPAIALVWLTSRLFHHWGFPPYRRQRETQSAITAHVAETITGVRVVKAFGAEKREYGKLEALHRTYRRAVLDGARVSGAYIPGLSLTFHTVMVIVLVVGARQVTGGELGLGALFEFVMLLGFVLGPVEGLGGLYNESLIAGAAAERIFLLLDTEPEVVDRPDAKDPGRLRGEVTFDHVSFSYDPSGKSGRQLDDVSFHAAAGATVALVGATGAGKSSIMNVLGRFYDVAEGTVRIDGIDVRDMPVAALHRQMGIVLQESFLFAGSVLENLRFVEADLTPEQARDAFAELDVAELLDRLPDGLETDVGERGANLSEGERQIVCFVRALVANPALLVLDEATSAVDTRTEALLLRALRRLAEHQTTFIIAHRLSTIRDADRILVVDAGRVVEQGTHDELIARGGVYTALYSEYAG